MPTPAPFASRVIERLDARIAAAEGVLEREYLKARRAAALARHGQLSEARFALTGLRSQSQRLRDRPLVAWTMLVDALIDHCESLAPTAREKFRRAYEAAAGATDPAVQAECAAWLALSDLNASDREGTARHAAEALRLAAPDAHSAIARAALVVGDAWRFAGEAAFAQPWYARVRQHATAEGDFSLVSMLLYNMAAFSAYSIALADAFDRADRDEAHRVLLEADSTGNFDAGIGNAQLAAQVPLLRAQLLTVLGEYAAAVSLIDATLPRARSEGQAHREARYLADAAYAEARLGRLDEAARRLRALQPGLARLTEPDDLAGAHARLSFVTGALGRAAEAERHGRVAAAAFARHEAEQQQWREALAGAGLAAPG